MASKVDWFGLRMETHNKGDDCCGEITADVVGDVALSVVFVDFGDAVNVHLLILEIVVAGSESGVNKLLLCLILNTLLVIEKGLIGIKSKILDRS